MANWVKAPLEFDEEVWQELKTSYSARGLTVRESHRHQCYFPAGSVRLRNPVGTALGFYQRSGKQHYVTLPGPPRELEGVWNTSVERILRGVLPESQFQWRHWACIGVPESEVAELVEPIIGGHGIEVGYRASIPYVKVKLYLDARNPKHREIGDAVDAKLSPFDVGQRDLAEEFLERAGAKAQNLSVLDQVTGLKFSQRLFTALKDLQSPVVISAQVQSGFASASLTTVSPQIALTVGEGDTLLCDMQLAELSVKEAVRLPFKISLTSDRGQTAATEWALWTFVKALRKS
jgi:nicotinamide-nucleotide amidase